MGSRNRTPTTRDMQQLHNPVLSHGMVHKNEGSLIRELELTNSQFGVDYKFWMLHEILKKMLL